MNLKNFLSSLFLIGFLFSGCSKSSPEISTNANLSEDSISPNPNKILVDASRDGGVWWFPQSSDSAFHADQYHQGKALVDWLIDQGYQVDELGRGTVFNTNLLKHYSKIIRAGAFGDDYTNEEILAYKDFLQRKGSLLLIRDFVNNLDHDYLSENILGLQFEGIITGGVTLFAHHPITSGVDYLMYGTGSVITNAKGNPHITILGKLDSGYYLDRNLNGIYDGNDIIAPAVMGILDTYPKCRIFFIGDINGLEYLPQPFTENLFNWLFQ